MDPRLETCLVTLPIGSPPPPDPVGSAHPIVRGAGPVGVLPDDADPAANEHASIDLVSDTSGSDDGHSDSDDDSNVAVLFLLRDPHAPMVTVSLEEQALTPARTLVRVPYWEHLLELVQRGCLEADFHTAIEPALAQAHADLATHLATILVGLFDPARLASGASP